jgi:hypothetical protein
VALFLGIYKGNILAVPKVSADSELTKLETAIKPASEQTKDLEATEVSQNPQVVSSKPKGVMELKFDLAKVSLEFVGLNPVTSSLYPVLGFYLNNLDVLVRQSEGMNATLNISSIEITDIRTDASPNFKVLLGKFIPNNI